MLRQQGQGLSMTSADMNIPLEEVEKIRALPGVAFALPVGQNLEMGGGGGLGIRQLEGINYAEFAAATKLRIIAGQPLPDAGDVAIIDFKEAASKKLKVGDKLRALQDRELTIVGIYEPEMGARVKAYDPIANDVCARQHPDLKIEYAGNAVDLAEDCDALVIVTEWEEFRYLDLDKVGEVMHSKVLIDGRNVLDPEAVKAAGFNYRGIGR